MSVIDTARRLLRLPNEEERLRRHVDRLLGELKRERQWRRDLQARLADFEEETQRES